MAQQEVKPYTAQEGKKEQVSRMFNRIAPYYDFLNRLLSAGIDLYWRKRAAGMLPRREDLRILDVATGTADFALEIRRQQPTARITGVDISTAMLGIGREKIKAKGWQESISLYEGDSERLPFDENTFDCATVAFGVRNFERPISGLQEIRRVLKPGGQLVVLEFSKPRVFPFRQIFTAYFKYLLPAIGRLNSKDPRAYRYLYESVQAFPDGGEFVEMLLRAGFREASCTPLTLGICSIYASSK